MNVDKNLTIDLNRVQPVKVLRIHEGDVNSVRLVLKITKDNTAFSLTGISAKYDAVIAGFLAESDANATISDGKVIVPVTQNMTAKSGLLQIDVKLIEGTAIVFTQTLTLLVDRAVINEDTIIDISGTSIGMRLADIETTLQTKADAASVYTKTEVNNKLAGKENFVYQNISDLSACDEMTDASTIYRFYYNGSYQLLINTSPTGGQYRFTKFGDIYFREYNLNSSVWGSWVNFFTKIPNDTIIAAMIPNGEITYEKLYDNYIRYHNVANLDNADNLTQFAIYTGSSTSSWRSQYGNDLTDFILLNTFNRQLLIFPGQTRIFCRYHNVGPNYDYWGDWEEISYYTQNEIASRLNYKASIESGTIGENYAWYTDPSQNLRMTGVYTLMGNYVFLSATASLIQGWERVYYSLPVACEASSATVALNGNNNYTIATGTQNNVSVLEIKQIGTSSMSSGTIRFTLIYKYTDINLNS